MKNLLLTILALLMLIATTLSSAEIIPVWNKTVEGKIQDMEFLKGQNEILMLVGEGSSGQIQRRSPEDGTLIHSFPQFMSSFTKLAITPDSLRFVQINGIDGSLRNISDRYSIMSTFSLSENQEDSILVYFTSIAVDPIRPYAYATTYGWNKNTNNYAPRGKVIAYNYETGEHIKDLTPYGEYEYTAIEVSDDGKYLATLNDNKAYLKVWDLETMEQIINEPLFDDSDDRCEAEDIYFSKLDENVIYISGFFSKKISSKDVTPPSIYKFNLQTKSRELILPNEIYSGAGLIFLDNETRVISTTPFSIGVLNLMNKSLEWYNKPPMNVFSSIVRYNNKSKYFIGASNNDLSKFLYDSQSSIDNKTEDEIVISPNPTNSFVSINLNCTSESVSYSIITQEGKQIEQKSISNNFNELQIDFSTYPSGVYFITITCGNELKSYKVVRE